MNQGNQPQVCLWHTFNATSEVKIQGVWHASVLRRLLHQAEVSSMQHDELHWIAEVTWPHVKESLQRKGWDLETAYLDGERGCLQFVSD